MSTITRFPMLDETGQEIVKQLGQIVSAIGRKTYHLYGFHINGNESNPANMVTYLEDAVGMTPAHMDFTNNVFDYGSWADAFFMPRPCIIGMDGQVRKYLNPNDYTKDINGNTVAIDDTLTDANVMIEFPKIYYKVVADSNDDKSGSVYISDYKIDGDFKDYAYIDDSGVHKEHFYMPAYNGSYDTNSKMRSISGAQVGNSLNATTEISRAQANGTGWYTEDVGEAMLINFLLVLMGKSTNTQAVFGQGLSTSGDESVNDGFRTGVHNTKGLFYGTNSGAADTYTNAVKIFGIENWWGFQWRRYAGDINVSGTRKIKLCKSREDGSSVNMFNTTGDGYVDIGATPSGTSGGYISQMKFVSDKGMFSVVSSGSQTTYYCDGQWFSNTQTDYAIRGGASYFGALVGAFCVHLNGTVGSAHWSIGASLSFK